MKKLITVFLGILLLTGCGDKIQGGDSLRDKITINTYQVSDNEKELITGLGLSEHSYFIYNLNGIIDNSEITVKVNYYEKDELKQSGSIFKLLTEENVDYFNNDKLIISKEDLEGSIKIVTSIKGASLKSTMNGIAPFSGEIIDKINEKVELTKSNSIVLGVIGRTKGNELLIPDISLPVEEIVESYDSAFVILIESK